MLAPTLTSRNSETRLRREQRRLMARCELRSSAGHSMLCLRERLSLHLQGEVDNRPDGDAAQGPFASHGRPSSIQHVEAISRCTHGVSSTNSLMNHAAVLAPPPRPVLVLRISAMSLLIIC